MDEKTLVETYQKSVHSLYAYVARRCGSDRGLAEDVTQETWLRAVRAWRNGDAPDRPLAWLKTVARNLILNYYRRAPMVSMESLSPDWESRYLTDAQSGEAQREASDALNWGLARLRPAQAELLETFYLDGRSVRDIAKEKGLSEKAVEGRLSRARKKLRKKMAPLIQGEGGQP
jgi:RNA polymerase sigma-70 factor (ECF subfamily)